MRGDYLKSLHHKYTVNENGRIISLVLCSLQAFFVHFFVWLLSKTNDCSASGHCVSPGEMNIRTPSHHDSVLEHPPAHLYVALKRQKKNRLNLEQEM